MKTSFLTACWAGLRWPQEIPLARQNLFIHYIALTQNKISSNLLDQNWARAGSVQHRALQFPYLQLVHQFPPPALEKSAIPLFAASSHVEPALQARGMSSVIRLPAIPLLWSDPLWCKLAQGHVFEWGFSLTGHLALWFSENYSFLIAPWLMLLIFRLRTSECLRINYNKEQIYLTFDFVFLVSLQAWKWAAFARKKKKSRNAFHTFF